MRMSDTSVADVCPDAVCDYTFDSGSTQRVVTQHIGAQCVGNHNSGRSETTRRSHTGSGHVATDDDRNGCAALPLLSAR